jgi:mono/diheme cytochrome c family protein
LSIERVDAPGGRCCSRQAAPEGRTCRKLALAALALATLAGCRLDMHVQPRYEPLRESRFFADGRASRHPPEGTVARGQLRDDELLYTGLVNGVPSQEFPFPITREVLERGRQSYDVFCAPCHDRTGGGDGMIVQRGYRRPPSMHIDRLRAAPPGYHFDVMTSGFGAMPEYRSQISARDRWSIAAYIRALQLSQHATIADVPAEHRQGLEPAEPPAAGQERDR